MAVVLVTGMSGTGKSAALAELARRGHRVVDTDYGDWCEEVPASDRDGAQQLWREDLIDALLAEHDDGLLFVSGCVPNQGTFYPRFDAVVLISAPAEVILERVAVRDTNDFGKSDVERAISSCTTWRRSSRSSAPGPRPRSILARRSTTSWTSSSASPAPSRGGSAHSHSMVLGGFDEMSRATRLTVGISLMIRLEIVSSRS